MFTDEELLVINREGLIPGPDENADAFYQRVHYCRNLRREIGSQLDVKGELGGSDLLLEAAPITQKLFDIVPEWAPVIFSNHRLAPWHGGCAWIFQQTPNTPLGAFFQLREVFAASKRYLGLYDRNELIAHEAAHVGRMAFEEPQFEEMLAYRTSKSGFRRIFGPIAQSPWESLVFVILVILSMVVNFLGLYEHLYLGWITITPWIFLGIGLGRLWVRHRQFQRCLHRLQEALGDTFKANAVIYRLRDEEIMRFGKLTREELLHEVADQRSLRWRVIRQAYFSTYKALEL